MRFKMLIGIIALTLFGCNTAGISHNSQLAKLSLPLIKSFLSQDGCNEILSTKNMGKLPDGDYFGKKLSKEHWRVEGCNKTYNLELAVSKDGKRFSVQKL